MLNPIKGLRLTTAAARCKVCAGPADEAFRLPRSKLTGQPIRCLAPGDVLAFRTAYYDPAVCARDWWHLGPANGHVSLFSTHALDVVAKRLGAKRRVSWNDYPGVRAWQL